MLTKKGLQHKSELLKKLKSVNNLNNATGACNSDSTDKVIIATGKYTFYPKFCFIILCQDFTSTVTVD